MNYKTRYRRKHAASNSALGFALFICVAAAIVVGLLYFDKSFVCHGGEIYRAGETSLDLRGAQEIYVDRLCLMDSLEYIDLRDSRLTVSQADELRKRKPDCHIRWTVPVNGQLIDSDESEISLTSPSQEDFEMLRFFNGLEKVNVTRCDMYDYMNSLNQEMPERKIVWTVPIGDREYKSTTVSIKLPNATVEDIDNLRYLPNLQAADMSGCTEYSRIAQFAADNPDCAVTWSVEILGQQVSSHQKELDISGIKVTDVSDLEAKLAALPNLEKVIMCDCGLGYDVLDQLNQRLENTRIVWRVYFGRWSVRTDATTFSTQQYEPPAYRLVDREVTVLKYCTDLEMLDLGHNSLTSVDSFADLTNLKVLILADNSISDISPLYKLTKLEYLEMFINRVSDISVVKNMPNLTDVNFCWNRISDPSPLYEHKNLQRVWMCGGQMSGATKREFMNALPDVEFDLYSTYGSTNGSWRHNDNFKKIREGFRTYNGQNVYHW